MKRLWVLVLLGLLAAPRLFADTQDTVVFRTRMLSDNEVPPIAAPGNSAAATITVRVARDDRGNINAATVTFDIDYTLTAPVTFTGLHIHNAPAGQNGPVVIDTGLSSTNNVPGAAGNGRISRNVVYGSTDTNGLRFVTGLLAMPELYYVNIHTTVNPGGMMRGQLLASRLIFRPVMSSAFEVPAVNLDAEGAAMVDVQVNRDPLTGAITSGTVIFDVDYRFPSAVTLTGLHIHNAAFGVNGAIVIDSGLNGTTRAVTNVTRGNIFRIAEIDSTNAAGLAALNGLFADPTQYYINMHTTVNPGGVIRGQLARNAYGFFNQMTQAEEVPANGVPGLANSMTYVWVNRDTTGNIANGVVSFNVNYNMGGATTFTGLHIHNAKFGVNGSVVINTGISAASPVVSNEGFGSVNREVPIDSSNQVALDSLRGLLENPENYYVNIHTTVFPGGIIRAQLVRETFHFKANMSTANEVPPVTGVDTAATGWITAKVIRDPASRVITSGTVTFDVNFTNTGPITFTGLHIHHPGVAGVNAGVQINTGLAGNNPVESTTGSGNITRVVDVPATNAASVAALTALVIAPDTAYVNLHTTQFPGGVVRSQMFPVVNPVAQVVGGGEWTTSLTIRNASPTTAVQGTVDFFQSDGSPMPEPVSDPNVEFLIPPSGSVVVNTFSRTVFAAGFAKVFSNGNVTVESRYALSGFTTSPNGSTTVTARSVSFPVAVGASASQNTGVALIANSAGTLNLSLRDTAGIAIAGGSRTIDVAAGQQIAQFVKQLLPSVTATQFTGTLTITTSAGTMSVMALQFNGTLAPVTVTALP